MSDHFFFPGQFKCMYCRVDLDADGLLALPANESIDLRCPACGAEWRFWTTVQLQHKLMKGGKYNTHQRVL